MTNSKLNPKPTSPHFDVEERTALFGERAINFAKKLPVTVVSRLLIDQVVRAATSVGANYCEANDAGSRPDFKHKLGICRKESKESMYWFRMIGTTFPESSATARELWQEAKELNLIFSAAIRSTKQNS